MFIPLFLILIVALAFISYYFARVIIYPRVYPYDDTLRREIEAGHIIEDQYTPWPKEEISIRSPYGYDLHAIYHPVPGSQKTIILSHGITWSLYGSVKYTNMFYRRGYNVLLYDLRNHGKSGGKNTTFGYYEKHDLKAVVDWAFSRLGPGGIVGTHGESMGAGTTLQHAAIDPRIAFAIADCSYSDLNELFTYRLRMEYHLPQFPLIPLANRMVWLLTGMSFASASPLRSIPHIHTPIFFIHGQNDTYILPKMSVDMYKAKCKGGRKLYLAPNADHAQAFWNNQAAYDQQIGEFLAEIGLE